MLQTHLVGDSVESPTTDRGHRVGNMDRSDISSWLNGPKEHLTNSGVDFGYPGQRLGLPETGVGSVAPMGRRLVALCIDWFFSILFVRVVSPSAVYGTDRYALLIMFIFICQAIFFTLLLGGSFGQRVTRVRITRIDGNRLSILRCVARTLLLALVIPAVIWDRDGRGLHDKVTGSVAVRG